MPPHQPLSGCWWSRGALHRACYYQPLTPHPSALLVNTGEVASALDKKCVPSEIEDNPGFEVCFSSLLLPVNETGATRPAEVLLSGGAQNFDAVVHMGLENGAKGLKLETVGANALGSRMSERFPAIPGAPSLLPITADLSNLMIPKLLDDLGQEIWSRDAGLFFCNEVLYRTMHAIRSTPLILRGTKSTLLPAIFIHLPCPNDVPPNEKHLCPTTNATSELIRMVGRVAARLVAPNMQ